MPGKPKLTDIERTRIGDGGIFGHPLRPQTVIGTDPQDGLPRVMSQTTLDQTKGPALDPETFVCMADESVFVHRNDWGKILISVDPALVERAPNGEHFVRKSKLDPRQQTEASYIHDSGNQDPCVILEPVRPQCQHYRRVMVDFEGDDEHRQVERTCGAQRDELGQHISLDNVRIYACEHRTPRDFVSEERLRSFDQKVVASGKKAQEEYDVEGALAQLEKEA